MAGWLIWLDGSLVVLLNGSLLARFGRLVWLALGLARLMARWWFYLMARCWLAFMGPMARTGSDRLGVIRGVSWYSDLVGQLALMARNTYADRLASLARFDGPDGSLNGLAR